MANHPSVCVFVYLLSLFAFPVSSCIKSIIGWKLNPNNQEMHSSSLQQQKKKNLESIVERRFLLSSLLEFTISLFIKKKIIFYQLDFKCVGKRQIKFPSCLYIVWTKPINIVFVVNIWKCYDAYKRHSNLLNVSHWVIQLEVYI